MSKARHTDAQTVAVLKQFDESYFEELRGTVPRANALLVTLIDPIRNAEPKDFRLGRKYHSH